MKKVNLVEELQNELYRLYGPLLTSKDLWKVLGYRSPAAYRQARVRNMMPVKEFQIKGRKGYFALTIDVVNWLAEQRLAICDEDKQMKSI